MRLDGLDAIVRFQQRTSWDTYSTFAGEKLATPIDKFRVPKVDRSPSQRVFSESRPTIDDVTVVLARTFTVDDTGRCSTPSAGNIQAVRLSLLAFPEDEFYSMQGGDLCRVGVLPAGTSEKLTYGQITGRAWLVLLWGDIEVYVAKYGVRAYRFVFLEAGHIGQALMQDFHLAGMATCPLGGFNDYVFEEIVGSIWHVRLPLYIVAAGGGPPTTQNS